MYFTFLCWHLWLARNERIFNNQSHSQSRIVHKGIQFTTKYLYLACLDKTIKIRNPRIIKWIAPLEPFIKLNTDDSVIGNPGMAGAGNLLRNNASARISGFSLNMGITSNNIAVGVVQQGLILAWELGFKFIHLEINSMTVLSWLTTKNDISPDAILLLCDCRNLVEHDWTVQVCHIFREANGCTDALAKSGNQ